MTFKSTMMMLDHTGTIAQTKPIATLEGGAPRRRCCRLPSRSRGTRPSNFVTGFHIVVRLFNQKHAHILMRNFDSNTFLFQSDFLLAVDIQNAVARNGNLDSIGLIFGVIVEYG